MISVCMATYNGEKFIFKQIESILSQLNDDDELIISDNSSDDGTIEIIDSFNDKIIKLLTLDRDKKLLQSFKGIEKTITQNFENALNQATGDIIFLSDQDDVWYNNKTQVMVPLLLKYSLVVCDCSIINEFDLIIKEKWI